MSQLPTVSLDAAQARFAAAPESRSFAPLALALRQQGDLTAAAQLLRAGLERHPRYVSAWVLLGLCCRDLQQEEEAEAAFGRVLELDPENLVALRFRAERARRRGALDRALELLRRALEIDPFDREVQADLGLLSAAVERRLQTEARPAPAPPAPPAAAPAAPPAIPEPAEEPSEPASAPQPPGIAAVAPPPEELRALRGGAEVPPLSIDLGRVGRAPETPPFVLPTPDEVSPPPWEDAEPHRPETAETVPPAWRVTRDEDRITVSPDVPPPVRGPIRSVEERLWMEQRACAAVPSSPPETPAVPSPRRPAPPVLPPSPGPSPAPLGGAAGNEFATLTLARIYESQGYLQKALAIYEELRRRHPEDGEVAARLAALQRRLASAAAPPPVPSPAPAAPPPVPAPEPDPSVEWRLVDARGLGAPDEAAERLRDRTREARSQQRAREHTFIGTPPPEPPAPEPPAAPPSEDLSRGHPDFERFLSYVRSLRPPAEP